MTSILYPVKKNDRKEKIAQLYSIFGTNTRLSRETIEQELDRNTGDFNKTMDALLQMSIKPLNEKRTPEEIIQTKNVDTIHNMFGGELTRSIISTVYLQNQGDVQTTVDTLLDISHDDDAIEAIRNMTTQQKEELEANMKSEQEKRLQERQVKLEQELELDRKRLANLEQKQQKQMILPPVEKEEFQFLPNETNKVVETKAPNNNVEREKEIREEVARLTDCIAHKEFLVSKILQQAALCTLSVRYGLKTIIVSWSLGEDMKTMPGDWIGFFKVGLPPQNYKRYIKSGGARQGHVSIPAPKTPGLYHFKYFVDGSYNEVCVSDVIHIGPQIVIKASLIEVESDEKKNEVEVTFNLKGGELSSNDWFGLFNASECNNKNYITYHKVGALVSQSTASFRFPAPRLPGDYIIKFFPNLCGYTHVARSNPLRIINKDKLNIELISDANTNGRIKAIKVSWDIHSVDVNSYDYIALYKQEALNNYYESFQYVDLKANCVIFEAPKEVTSFNLRYHSSTLSKYVDIARSDPIQIQNTDTITATVGNGIITVTWDIYSQPQTSWDWIGIFEEGAPNTTYLMFKYVDVNTNVAIFQPIPTSGKRYEARYFSSKVGKYVDFRKSTPFTV